MVKTLELAIEELTQLPESDQEQIGRRLLSHVEKLRELRVDVDQGLRSLDAGQGQPLGSEEFIQESNASGFRHGGMGSQQAGRVGGHAPLAAAK